MKYGNTNGKHQEEESEALLRPFLEEYHLPKQVEDRIVYLVTHHHTYADVEGMDYQILLEADFLVNADESRYDQEKIDNFRRQVFRTESGSRILEAMY